MSSEVSPSTRFKVWLESIPLMTRGILIVCSVVYAANLLTGFDDLGLVCLMPAPVLDRWQVYRFLTSAIFHVGLLHLVFNMMAFIPIGSSLERALGSVQLLWLVGLLCVLGDLAYMAIAYLGSFTSISYVQHFWHQCAVGFSGVVFGLIVADNHMSGAHTRSIFGFFNVPAKAYPWALLVVWQVLMPQVSFLGHLAGVLVGQLYVWGYLRWAMLSNVALQHAERSVLFAPCYHRSGFIAHTGAGAGALGETLPTLSRPHGAGLATQGSGWLRGVWMPYPAYLNPLRQEPEALQPHPERGQQPQQTGGAQSAGGAQEPTSSTPSKLEPKVAAAAAAEARMARAAGGSSGTGPAHSSSAPNLSQQKK